MLMAINIGNWVHIGSLKIARIVGRGKGFLEANFWGWWVIIYNISGLAFQCGA